MWTGYRADEDTTDSITMLLLLGALVPLLRTMKSDTAEIVNDIYCWLMRMLSHRKAYPIERF